MSDPQAQGNQQELFNDFAHESRRAERIPSIAKTQKPILISTTLEQLLLVCIISILFFCLVFFLGVLRGRSVASAISIKSQSSVPMRVAATTKQAAAARPILRVSTIPAIQPKENSFVVLSEAPTKPYTIQVLTTKKKAYADEEVSFLRKSGFASSMSKSGDYYVVCVGSYSNKEEARKDLSYFGGKYKGRYLRRK